MKRNPFGCRPLELKAYNQNTYYSKVKNLMAFSLSLKSLFILLCY
jgi:hypothetical protein